MAEMTYDALIIGGGPGGSTAATVLARAGRRVLVLEKEFFPRFHIGESLLPYNEEIFRELGVLPKLEAAGLIRKHGAQFHLANGSHSLSLIFRNGAYTRYARAFQVERASFDHLLLTHAREAGAEVREGWAVSRFETAPDSVRLEARDPDGKPAVFTGRFLIDASGRGNLTGNQEGLRTVHPNLRKLAVFGHFTGVLTDPGEKGGDTIIVRLENKWFWLIPLTVEKVSVGCVMDAAEFAGGDATPEEIFTRTWRSSTVLTQRLANARLLGSMQTTSDFSYRNRRLVGPRLVRVGDAAGFMDPIFSAGVYLAMHSGRLAARLLVDSLADGTDGSRRLRGYEDAVNRSMKLYWTMVEGYYTKPFIDLFMQPRNKFNLPSAITALLGGELQGGWKVWWRMKLFFLLVWVQKRWPLLPPVSFQPVEQGAEIQSAGTPGEAAMADHR